MKNKGNVQTLTEGAMMVALAAVLSLITVWKMPLGGSITAGSMVPIVFFAMRAKPSWAILASLVFSGVQMLTGGIYPPPTPTVFYFALVILLDYVVAFGILGLAGIIAKPFKNRTTGAIVASISVCFGRFLCHYGTGVIIWGSADPAIPAWRWSLIYNGTYMLPEAIITTILVALLVKYMGAQKAVAK